ncbi:MAG: hypothetical protein HYX78_06875 [Armatimonadetes bacterium]|nr:hypothetical protein [Armatimonadota bacterium]
MRTVNRIRIRAEPDFVFSVASNLLDWPRMLPHYRWVHHIGGRGRWRIYEMAARRSFIPVKWISLTNVDPEARQIYFRHTGGLARGMEVVWSIELASGGTTVEIVHELSRLRVPIVRSVPGRIITGRVFVEYIAGQTLHYMKEWIEQRCVAQS